MATEPVQIVCGINGPIGYARRPGVAWTYPDTEARVSYLELPASVDECHHCGAPSPGDVCRYCNTAHRSPQRRSETDYLTLILRHGLVSRKTVAEMFGVEMEDPT